MFTTSGTYPWSVVTQMLGATINQVSQMP